MKKCTKTRYSFSITLRKTEDNSVVYYSSGLSTVENIIKSLLIFDRPQKGKQ